MEWVAQECAGSVFEAMWKRGSCGGAAKVLSCAIMGRMPYQEQGG